jgi:hypothetical protein
VIHEARADEQREGTEREQQRRRARDRLPIRAPREAVQRQHSEREQHRVHEPRRTQREPDRQERGTENGKLRVPAPLVDHVVHPEKLGIGIGGERQPAAQQDLRVKQLRDFIGVVRLPSEADDRERCRREQREQCGARQKYGPRNAEDAVTRRRP